MAQRTVTIQIVDTEGLPVRTATYVYQTLPEAARGYQVACEAMQKDFLKPVTKSEGPLGALEV